MDTKEYINDTKHEKEMSEFMDSKVYHNWSPERVNDIEEQKYGDVILTVNDTKLLVEEKHLRKKYDNILLETVSKSSSGTIGWIKKYKDHKDYTDAQRLLCYTMKSGKSITYYMINYKNIHNFYIKHLQEYDKDKNIPQDKNISKAWYWTPPNELRDILGEGWNIPIKYLKDNKLILGPYVSKISII